jgi:hypothetical protein
MSGNLAENDPFYKKQPIRLRKKRLQESSRLGQKNLYQELEALPSLKGILYIYFQVESPLQILTDLSRYYA